MSAPLRIGRRRFLSAVAAAIGAPHVISASALGRNGETPPSERIGLGAIGLGGRGRHDLGQFLRRKDIRCLAVCDCFADRRDETKAEVDRHHGNADCTAYRFHDDLLDRKDIDAVMIATGDRWHAILSMIAARAGKDIYCEKPSTMTIAEGRALVETTKRYDTVWQCGTQRRSNPAYRFVVDVVRGGRIGKLRTITTLLGSWGGNGFAKPEKPPPPEIFDYDRWLGPSPWAPYSPVRVGLWRNHWDTSAGVIPDMGAHYFDFAQWTHDSELSGPIEYEGRAVWPDDGFANVPFEVDVEARYADRVRLLIKMGPKGVRFDGDTGWIHLSDEGVIAAEPAAVLEGLTVPRVSWEFMDEHIADLIDAMRTRRPTASNPELAQRAHTICHCASICLRLGRPVRWDPRAERFIDDDDANRMLARTLRAPWRLG